jgi:AmiR/NasT family two-component response regulator
MLGEGRRPPVLVLTAFADDSVYEVARELGVMAVLSKPVDLDDFRLIALLLALAGRPRTRP